MSSTGVFGRVKWFNSRAGYGFVTVTAGDHSGGDVFVHHSSLSTGILNVPFWTVMKRQDIIGIFEIHYTLFHLVTGL